jgi:hypothetical protein
LLQLLQFDAGAPESGGKIDLVPIPPVLSDLPKIQAGLFFVRRCSQNEEFDPPHQTPIYSYRSCFGSVRRGMAFDRDPRSTGKRYLGKGRIRELSCRKS